MRRIIVLGSLAVAALASVVLLGVVPNLQTAKSAGCSTGILRGTYGFLGDGITVDKGPWATIGFETFDGVGKISSVDQTGGTNGKVGHFNYTGTYRVNANCSGTIEFPFPEGTTHLSIVVVDGGREFLWIALDTPFYPSGVTWHGITKKI